MLLYLIYLLIKYDAVTKHKLLLITKKTKKQKKDLGEVQIKSCEHTCVGHVFRGFTLTFQFLFKQIHNVTVSSEDAVLSLSLSTPTPTPSV